MNSVTYENNVTSSFLIVYASQTGNAKSIAEDISELCETKRLRHEITCVSEIGKKFSLERISCLVLVGSTTGDGDPPDPARKFWRLLNKKDQPRDTLSHLSYTILGLGDTNYTNFCNFGKSVDQRLDKLGAIRFYPCGWADDGTGLDVVVEPWIEGLPSALKLFLKDNKKHNGSKSNCISNCNGMLVEESLKSNVDAESSLEKINSTMEKVSSDMPEKDLEATLKTSEDAVKNIADKFDLDVLPKDQLQILPVKSCFLTSDAKLSLPLKPATYLVLKYIDDAREIDGDFTPPLPSVASDVFDMKLDSVKQLTTTDAVKTTLEVTLQLSEENVAFCEYLPGDSFGMIVKNPQAEVELLLSLLGLMKYADKIYELTVDKDTKKKSASIPKFIPAKSSVRYVFENCLDIRTVPKKPLIRSLVEYTSDPIEQQRLKELVSKEGSGEYSKYVRESSLSLLDLLVIFQSCKPPVTILLEHLPQLQPRAYSVITSPLQGHGKISFAFNVIDIPREGTVTFHRKGICTGWLSSFVDCYDKKEDGLSTALSSLTIDDSDGVNIQIYLRSNQTFHLPNDEQAPIIMVGPGTGVAPFVGFLRHRQMAGDQSKFGESWLFFGCRHINRDFLYRKELEMLQKENVLSHLVVCFSRDEVNATRAKYVQDNICLHGADLASLIVDKGAVVYVCGDAKNMAKDVFEAFVSILEVNRGLSTVEARKYIAQLQIDKRYLQDVWA